MGYDTDTRKVAERFNKWGETAVITNDDFTAVNSLIQRNFDERSRVFDDLLNAFKPEYGVQGAWDSLCDRGLALHENLNNAIGSKIPNGFAGLGMSDFHEGEKAAWQACKNGRIGLIAEAIYDIGKNDMEIAAKLEEDLKKAREEAKSIDEEARAAFSGSSESVKAMGRATGGLVAATGVALLTGIASAASAAKRMASSLVGTAMKSRELGKKKKAIKNLLLSSSEIVDKARDKAGDGAINDVRRRADEVAMSWKGAGSRGDYAAADWEQFGRACCQETANKAVRATERAKTLFQNTHPLLIELMKTKFVTLLSDPASLAAFNGQLDADITKIFEDLTKENQVILALRDGVPKKTAVAQMDEMLIDVNAALKDLKLAMRENEELLKT